MTDLALRTPENIANDIALIGKKKAEMPSSKMTLLSILAGLYVSLGAIFMTFATHQTPGGFVLTKILGGIVFSTGLILVVLAGGELFTGNSLMVLGYHDGHFHLKKLLRNWFIVYTGNFAGALLAIFLVYFSGIWHANGGLFGLNFINIAAMKAGLPFWEAFVKGIGGNLFVCLAIWLAASGENTLDKIAAIVFPITAFVALGFEHSIANMFIIPFGLMLKSFYSGSWPALTLFGFFKNLAPVTAGNIIGGTAVGAAYFLIYKRKQADKSVLYLKNKLKKVS